MTGLIHPPAGFMTAEERKVFENIRSPHLKYWIPVVWFSNLASKARQEGRIQDSIDLQNLLNVNTTSRYPVKQSTTCTSCQTKYNMYLQTSCETKYNMYLLCQSTTCTSCQTKYNVSPPIDPSGNPR